MLQGRFHLYEGHDPGLVVQPVLLFRQARGADRLLTNAAGGVNPAYGAGTLMVIADHLNLTGEVAADRPQRRRPGTRASRTSPTSGRRRCASASTRPARPRASSSRRAIYAGLLGPSYETPAEVRMLRTLGADAVGMSTVLEAVAARWVGLEVCGVSLVTNAGAGYSGQPLTHAEVLEAGEVAGPRLAQVLRRFLADLPAPGSAGLGA